ncbi:DUF1441 family protein [Verrucomicrobia bacterium]|jgi:hypothetical protein|nr:DUF1441 family protein [Verrucomicrobiota bacterium]
MKKRKVSNQTTVEGVTLTEVAQVWGKSRDTVRNQMVSVNPIGKRGLEHVYSLPAVKAVMEKIQPRSEKDSDREELEKRKLELQCERLQIDIDERLGKLMPIDDVRHHFATHTSTVRMHLLKMGGELAPVLQGLAVAKAEKKINASGERVLAKLREMAFE